MRPPVAAKPPPVKEMTDRQLRQWCVAQCLKNRRRLTGVEHREALVTAQEMFNWITKGEKL